MTQPLAKAWSAEGLRIAAALNEMMALVHEQGWGAWKGDIPADRRTGAEAEEVLVLLREANAAGMVDEFRKEFAPAHAPFAESLMERATSVGQLVWIDDTRVAFVVGTPWTTLQGYMLDVASEELTPLEDTRCIGASPDRRFFARVSSQEIAVHEGWDGEVVARLAFPDAWDGDGQVRLLDGCYVLPDGQRVVAVSNEGVFLIGAEGAVRVHPQPDPTDDEWTPEIDMGHAAVSPDGDLICVGDQSSTHRVLTNKGEEVASIGTASEYAHHAAFSHDGGLLALNSCHMYSGGTLAVSFDDLPGMGTEDFLGTEDLPDGVRVLDDGMRVYASDAVPGTFLLGDAGGDVRAIHENGDLAWEHHVGSSISGLAVSPNGKMLVVGSSSGMLHVIDLDQGEADPYQIGTGAHVERRRWIFWEGEERPLRW